MRYFLALISLAFCISSCNSLKEKEIQVKGGAKLIGMLNENIKKENGISFKSSNGINFNYSVISASGIIGIYAKFRGENVLIWQSDDSASGLQEFNTYEYDFDKDGNKEYLLIQYYSSNTYSYKVLYKLIKIKEEVITEYKTFTFDSFEPSKDFTVKDNTLILVSTDHKSQKKFIYRDEKPNSEGSVKITEE